MDAMEYAVSTAELAICGNLRPSSCIYVPRNGGWRGKKGWHHENGPKSRSANADRCKHLDWSLLLTTRSYEEHQNSNSATTLAMLPSVGV